MTEIILGGVTASKQRIGRLAVILCGPPGMGKTTLAATMPGRKLFMSFDPDGMSAIPQDRDDVKAVDLSNLPVSFYGRLKDYDPFGIEKYIDEFDTLIVDSLTMLVYNTLQYSITQTKGATVERPSMGAYGARGGLTLAFITNLLALTGKHNKHLLVTTHEGPPDKTEAGTILNYPKSLGGSIPTFISMRFNEDWTLFEADRKKMIIVRKSRLRDAKTRMFDTNTYSEFVWKFDPMKWEGMTIDDWYKLWQANDLNKIPLPGSGDYEILAKKLLG